jgi:hypothetical protein
MCSELASKECCISIARQTLETNPIVRSVAARYR